MDVKLFPSSLPVPEAEGSGKKSQTLMVDGCKVTLNYADTSAVNVLSDIKKNLIAQYVTQK